MSFFLAIKCFFLIWFGKRLPDDPRLLKLLPPAPEPVKELPPKPAPPPEKPKVDGGPAVQLLGLLQREGRLLDFLCEPIDGFDDAQVGAAVRSIHKGCKKVIDQVVEVGPVRREAEDTAVSVGDADVKRGAVKLTGNVTGQPPFKGVLRHPGWQAAKVTLPSVPDGQDPLVISPAEVELA